MEITPTQQPQAWRNVSELQKHASVFLSAIRKSNSHPRTLITKKRSKPPSQHSANTGFYKRHQTPSATVSCMVVNTSLAQHSSPMRSLHSSTPALTSPHCTTPADYSASGSPDKFSQKRPRSPSSTPHFTRRYHPHPISTPSRAPCTQSTASAAMDSTAAATATFAKPPQNNSGSHWKNPASSAPTLAMAVQPPPS